MTPHKYHHEFEVLKQIYALYDETIKDQKMVCKKGCAACCTCNVTLTGLEAAYLSQALDTEAKAALKDAVDRHFPQKRYIPKITTNQFARLCMEGHAVPEEENNPEWGTCPALNTSLCSIYHARPFGCRALMSTIVCADHGYARVRPEIITTNTLFMQAIEHLDQNGISGNFSDIMSLFLGKNSLSKSEENSIDHIRKKITTKENFQFTANEKITVLMIEPEYRNKLSVVIQILSSFLK
ncbi:MAG: YkgJ family cysteine cluster protein [Proteobacteria bacterium]|nr:YkgJ family cysteine cluster protein [Pseudomonadota bacterium]MBU1386808.1 YkgJ family cysteine cluster protein [Pseudomonadota bacterium]MBU1544752.1 YkgJ family cysteine cluster protein [Pseudomonadota bacterium]MBU2430279.1 YkgJ family cysteine cluster protein [Pseudomonadota bacterium]MBU2483021.1 YkgJ family cysteine cluster protein [Pseudomonadota bacterium]